MKTCAFLIKFALCIVAAFCVGLGAIVFPPAEYRKGGIADSITPQKLRRVELGSSTEQVTAVLGPPIEVNSHAGDGLC
jgi:outer membrane protein assembly factor BamE (lipoprotein component of BamABCDE complex)